jgi:hypothetical protein
MKAHDFSGGTAQKTANAQKSIAVTGSNQSKLAQP